MIKPAINRIFTPTIQTFFSYITGSILSLFEINLLINDLQEKYPRKHRYINIQGRTMLTGESLAYLIFQFPE